MPKQAELYLSDPTQGNAELGGGGGGCEPSPQFPAEGGLGSVQRLGCGRGVGKKGEMQPPLPLTNMSPCEFHSRIPVDIGKQP